MTRRNYAVAPSFLGFRYEGCWILFIDAAIRHLPVPSKSYSSDILCFAIFAARVEGRNRGWGYFVLKNDFQLELS